MRTTAIVVLASSLIFTGCDRETPAVAFSDPHASATAPEGQRSVASNAAAAPTVATGRSKPEDLELTLPAGTTLPLVLDTPVASDTSRTEQPVRAHLARPVTVDGVTILPTGSAVSGVVTSAVRSGKVKGRAHVAVQFDTVTRRGDAERYTITTSALARTAPATKKQDTLKVAAPAAGGAVVGALFGGKKGALIGTGVGAGAGTAVVMSTRGKEVRLAKGTLVSVRLERPLTIRVPRA